MNRFNIALPLATLLVTVTISVAVAAASQLPASFYSIVTIARQNVRGARRSIGGLASGLVNRAVWSCIHVA